ncbi:MAG: hypothetical protein GTO51_06215 [Candidatus Latescibacteria bacterium]|nr:hypothetical protein [Candidatus Latescibacterota bacterium]NIM21385.1 hypothetical protein [Candidatus Latescibacterota bacterium]NIM65566.1 hypothetical protein [Candidatus Latescibacterota bacterium]NIO01946.1 hypothetical protein [Candidatus Latescibacterota bacterium]NIO28759.1 hypothetical protein [Candidatus Latescibacterota bacterium]
MHSDPTKLAIFVIAAALTACGWSHSSFGNDLPLKGERTAEEAAQFKSEPASLSPSAAKSLGAFALQPDTTEASLYEEEEEERNLVKEIIMWTIGGAFVSYFIIKVFLEGEEEESPPQKPGKEIPGSINTVRFPRSPW